MVRGGGGGSGIEGWRVGYGEGRRRGDDGPHPGDSNETHFYTLPYSDKDLGASYEKGVD